MILVGRGWLSHILDPSQVEVVACLQGLQAAIDLGITKVQQAGNRCLSGKASCGLEEMGSLWWIDHGNPITCSFELCRVPVLCVLA